MDKNMKNEILIGWGEADITPDGKVIELAGQYYQRVAKGIHSRIKAVAMLLEQDSKHSLMISLDLVGVPEDFCKNIQKAIAEKLPKIPADKIIINAIHTHSAPGLDSFRNWWKPAPGAITYGEYREFLKDKILAAVEKAWNSRQVSGIGNAVSFARIGHCRRAVYSNQVAEMYGKTNREDFTGMEGGEDSGIDLLFCFDKNGTPTGAVVNIACPSQIMESTYMVSSDFMGRLREMLKERFGNNFQTLCQIAPAGCQSPRDLTRPDTSPFWREAGVEIIAERLLNSIDAVYENISKNIKYDLLLEHSSEIIELPRRRASYEDYLHAKKKMEELENIQDSKSAYEDFCTETHSNEKVTDRPGPYDSKLHHFVRIRNEEAVINRFKDQTEKPDFKMQLHVVRLGEIAFATNPFELYLDFGHRIRARSKAKQTFMIQLCNGVGGYLPSKRAEKLGGYGGLIINGQVGSDGGTLLVDKTVEKINDLFRR
jgi:hypothetical protein